MSNKTQSITFPINERTNAAIVQKWHECVNEFCRSVGIDLSKPHEVKFLRSQLPGTETEVFIKNGNLVVGRVVSNMRYTPAGLKFTVTCQQVPPSSPAEPIEDDGVPHEIDYDRGDGTFVTASF